MKNIIEIVEGLKCMMYQSNLHLSQAQRDTIVEATEALKKVDELETVLDAWHTIFETTQLTHASDRLRVAEEICKKYKTLKDNICFECKENLPDWLKDIFDRLQDREDK